MKHIIIATVVVGLVGFCAPGYSFEEDWDALTNAKLARSKAKMRQKLSIESADDPSTSRRGDVKGSCGGVNIGNSTTERGGRGPKEVTILISGDIINANNKCK